MNQRSSCFLIFFLLIAQNSYALRCNQSLVVLGDTPHQVKATCGKPNNIRTITHFTSHGKSEKIQWTYNFGPREFKYVLTFKRGKLVKMVTAGYGE